MHKYVIAIMIAAICSVAHPTLSWAGWKSLGNEWQYEEEGVFHTGRWMTDKGENYYLDSGGYMKTGWIQLSDAWYFLNILHDGTYGKALRGWHWIDGYCYFFQQDGKMLANTVTPDGFHVSESGVWTIDGRAQYVKNKGIITLKSDIHTSRFTGSSGGGGSSGSSTGSSSGSSAGRPQNTTYTYTVQYMDIQTDAVLHVITGQGRKNDSISIEHLDFDNYVICTDQKTEFTLASKNQVIKLYYEKQQISSPSDAEKVSWQVYFVEKDNIANEVLRSQKGTSPEGTELIIDFPEIICKNETYYHSLTESPYQVFLFGAGTQKIYIEFSKSVLPEEPNIDAPALERLNQWLELSRKADESLTGMVSMDGQLVTNTLAESNVRLKNLASMAEDTKRHEVYLIAKNHLPSSFVLGQFSNIGSISEHIMDCFLVGEDEYTILKVGFQAAFKEESCSHNFIVVNDSKEDCLAGGSETIVCDKCSYEVTVIIPAIGHQILSGRDICSICHQVVLGNEMPEAVYFEEDDMQARRIGNRIYLFRCIDEDYEDSLNNKQKSALFLCEQVIRSDIDSTLESHKSMTFGGDNNYKSSTVRTWLKTNASDSLFGTNASYIGIPLAYLGATQKGTFDQLDETNLTAKGKPFQLLEDNIFLLSVEEAVKYREYLWKFNDSTENNPESQYSAYSKGYWLRTPQYTDRNGQFRYGTGAYMVNLTDGNIHTANVDNRSIGIRPAITVPQH